MIGFAGTRARLAGAVAITLAIAVASGPTVTEPATAEPDLPPPSGAAIPPVPPRFAEDGKPAREWLRALSKRGALSKRSATPLKQSGPSVYVHTRIQVWSLETGAVKDIEVWRARDGSAYRHGVLALPAPLTEITEFGAGQYPLAVDNPSPHPEILAGQLVQLEHRPGPEDFIRAVATMFKDHCLTPEQLTATLQVLADVDGLIYRGSLADRKGRDGMAITFDSSEPDGRKVRDILILDEQSGDLLSHEQVILVLASGSPARPPVVLSYVLYLGCEHTDRRP